VTPDVPRFLDSHRTSFEARIRLLSCPLRGPGRVSPVFVSLAFSLDD
jgi:hypothetical protein